MVVSWRLGDTLALSILRLLIVLLYNRGLDRRASSRLLGEAIRESTRDMDRAETMAKQRFEETSGCVLQAESWTAAALEMVEAGAN